MTLRASDDGTVIEQRSIAETRATTIDDAATEHRHLCPRQILGARMGRYAGEVLGLALPRRDKRLYVLIETDGCLADSVTVATGSSMGHRTMRLVDHGKTAATFVDTTTGRAYRIHPRADVRKRAELYAPDAPSRWHAQRDAYQVMPATELLCADEVELAIDLAAVVSRPGKRVACAECGEEVMNDREVVVDGRTYCRGCTGDCYYRPRRG